MEMFDQIHYARGSTFDHDGIAITATLNAASPMS
jgi:hypothetical protein